MLNRRMTLHFISRFVYIVYFVTAHCFTFSTTFASRNIYCIPKISYQKLTASFQRLPTVFYTYMVYNTHLLVKIYNNRHLWAYSKNPLCAMLESIYDVIYAKFNFIWLTPVPQSWNKPSIFFRTWVMKMWMWLSSCSWSRKMGNLLKRNFRNRFWLQMDPEDGEGNLQKI